MKRMLWLLCLLLTTGRATAQDAVDLHSCVLTPNTVMDWTVTSPLTLVDMRSTGLHLEWARRDAWPNVVPPGWAGPIQFTVWFGTNINGKCHLAASLNYWKGRPDNESGPITWPSHFPQNLWYLDSALATKTPVEGEPLYIMVTAGGWRGITAFSVAERTNVVSVPFPSEDGATYTFNATTQPPVVTPPVSVPIPTPIPTPTQPTVPSLDLSIVTSLLQQCIAEVKAVGVGVLETHDDVNKGRQENKEWQAKVTSKYMSVVNSAVFKYGVTAFTTWYTTKMLLKSNASQPTPEGAK